MKQLFIIATFFITVGSIAQSGFNTVQFPVKGQLVKVKNWGSRTLMILSDNYFSATRDSIIYQVGQEEFDELKNRCSANGWPGGLYISGVSDEEDKAFDVKMNRLKMYRIAVYTHIYNGKTFDRYAILRVPYEENRDWDTSVKWTGNIYFLLKDDDVETIQ